MIAKQSVYLNLARDKAHPEGHEEAKFLLVRAGQEVNEADLGRYEGASDLADTEPEAKEQPVIPPPTLKEHSQESTQGSRIPEPSIKGDEKEAKSKTAPNAAPVKKKKRAKK